MIVYITRPNAYEFYMGGLRDFRVWLDRPSYSHQSRSYDAIGGETKYVDHGWHHPHCTGQRAKFLLSQDDVLKEAVLAEAIWSAAPKGVPTYDDAERWANTIIGKDAFGELEYAWHYLFEEKDWEGKCNVCWKRFLLKVNLRTNEVQRLKPFVALRNGRNYEETDEITPELAIEYFHPEGDHDDIPF